MKGSAGRVPGLTVQRTDPGFAMQAQLTGFLAVKFSTNCLVLRFGRTAIDVAWPLGWSTGIREGRIALIDAAGGTAAFLGDEVSVGGGHVEAERVDAVSCTGADHLFQASGLTRL